MSYAQNNSRAMVAIITLITAGAALFAAPARAGSNEVAPDRLVLRSRSSFVVQELTVDLGPSGSAELRTCDPTDRFGCCKDWQINQRHLTHQEHASLQDFARRADLFGGHSTGAQIDLAYRTLEVHARDHNLAVLVTTLNDSFTAAGPRRELLKMLIDIEKELESRSELPHD